MRYCSIQNGMEPRARSCVLSAGAVCVAEWSKRVSQGSRNHTYEIIAKMDRLAFIAIFVLSISIMMAAFVQLSATTWIGISTLQRFSIRSSLATLVPRRAAEVASVLSAFVDNLQNNWVSLVLGYTDIYMLIISDEISWHDTIPDTCFDYHDVLSALHSINPYGNDRTIYESHRHSPPAITRSIVCTAFPALHLEFNSTCS